LDSASRVEALASFRRIDAEGSKQLSGWVRTLTVQKGEQEEPRLDAPSLGGARFVKTLL
jgi:hypothetical protein